MKEAMAFIATASKGIGSRRLATYTQVTCTNPQTELPSESQKGGIRPKLYITEFHCPYSCLKGRAGHFVAPGPGRNNTKEDRGGVFPVPVTRAQGHSCKRCLSNYELDLEPKMPKHFLSILSSFSSNERSRGLHCYSIKVDWVPLLSVFFVQENTGSLM